ncbi:Lrp/AsnC family transcriptional regulator [Zhihengliuella salsuginis]|uniref:Transcriptional regulator, AsnC family protein n=1 Tax=Zhihengliuella salsuginis TaxID=578222 RepID=A0ABQ3GIW5_9MICC|nr:Lrp/AsnC family transcriptional regulator [Zhihengliuella salsuginis]GHD06485.1 putative transcriptional regulator, AsnC family protein [Zhihengliuella salsuginis]
MNRDAQQSPAELLVQDGISRAIIEELQRNGRQSYAAVAKEVGLSEAAVRQRIQKLIDAQVMKIVAVTDPMQLGFTRQAMVLIKSHGDLTATADRVAELANVDYCLVTAGRADIMAEVVCTDDDDLLETINTIRQIEGVASSETLTYLSLRKQEYDWGTK